MPVSPLVQFLLAITAAGMALAFWKGGTAERLAAACVSANMLLGVTVMVVNGQAVPAIRFLNDGATALLLLAVAVRYGSPWMIGVMLFYAAQFTLHSYYLVTGRNERDYLHALVNNINNMGIIACLTLGVVAAWRRRLRTQRAGSWSPGRRRPG